MAHTRPSEADQIRLLSDQVRNLTSLLTQVQNQVAVLQATINGLQNEKKMEPTPSSPLPLVSAVAITSATSVDAHPIPTPHPGLFQGARTESKDPSTTTVDAAISTHAPVVIPAIETKSDNKISKITTLLNRISAGIEFKDFFNSLTEIEGIVKKNDGIVRGCSVLPSDIEKGYSKKVSNYKNTIAIKKETYAFIKKQFSLLLTLLQAERQINEELNENIKLLNKPHLISASDVHHTRFIDGLLQELLLMNGFLMQTCAQEASVLSRTKSALHRENIALVNTAQAYDLYWHGRIPDPRKEVTITNFEDDMSPHTKEKPQAAEYEYKEVKANLGEISSSVNKMITSNKDSQWALLGMMRNGTPPPPSSSSSVADAAPTTPRKF